MNVIGILNTKGGLQMLVLTRRLGESLIIEDKVIINVEKISNSKIRNKY